MIEADPLLAADVGYIVSLAGADVVDEEVTMSNIWDIHSIIIILINNNNN